MLRAALELLTEVGFEAMSMEAIVGGLRLRWRSQFDSMNWVRRNFEQFPNQEELISLRNDPVMLCETPNG